MERITLSVHPKDAAAKILKAVSHKRTEDILARRFGLKGGRRHTLESIGKSYDITRERVRQIEEAALKTLSENPAAQVELASLAPILKNHLMNHGGVSEERRFFESIADSKYHPHVHFLLALGKPVLRTEEDGEHHNRWHVNEEVLKKAETAIRSAMDELDKKKTVVSENELLDTINRHAKEVFGETKDHKSLRSYMGITKLIGKNPYGEYGLVTWPEINPRGVKDKAYAVLAKAGKPLHFVDIAKLINKTGWSKKSAHPQTVHNELIKDNRFVLVGRGSYALATWGYEPGTVSDVLVSILQKTGQPLSKEEIARRVLEKRLVKENTVFLNLQDKKRFKKVEGGYTLV